MSVIDLNNFRANHLQALGALCDVLKSKGVISARLGDIELRFASSDVILDVGASEVEDQENCKCGHHAVYAHSNGACLHGCDLAICEPQDEKAVE